MVSSVREYAITTLDNDGKITSWNQGARNITGWRAEEVLGRDHSVLYMKEDVMAGLPAHQLKQARERGTVEEEGKKIEQILLYDDIDVVGQDGESETME